jgi:hypothetical protein
MTGKPVARAVRLLMITAFIALLTPRPVVAQQVGGGVKGGVALGDIPNFGDSNAADTSERTGFAAGGFLMVRFPNGFAIQPEFLYTQKGIKISVPSTSDASLRTDFLDVPVLARFTFGKVVRGYVFAGPSFDFRLSAKVKLSGVGGGEDDISSSVKPFEVAFVAGGGVELGPILLEARWSEGLTDLFKDTPATISTPKLKTRTILFLGGFRF